MIEVQSYDSILEIAAGDWAKVASPSFPFTHYHFLRALETTDCLGDRTGWRPHYLLARQEGQIAGSLVAYSRTNSYGEFIFDFAWAQAFHQCGLNYYPKITSAVPFTPATGPKLLFAEDLSTASRSQVAERLLNSVAILAEKTRASSLHALFLPIDQLALYQDAGYFVRDSYQFQWHNAGYSDFTHFLGALKGKRRREILRERAQVARSGVRIARYSGSELSEFHAKQFYQFYLSTIDKRNSYDYLTEDFFGEVFASMKNCILLVMAFDQNDRPVAGALNYFGTNALYGRHWGCLAEYRALHFELCYYQGLEFAIERGFTKFEAGAQGEHKLQRGFIPTLTYSAHRIFSDRLDQPVRDFCQAEREQIELLFGEYKTHDPFQTINN